MEREVALYALGQCVVGERGNRKAESAGQPSDQYTQQGRRCIFRGARPLALFILIPEKSTGD